MKRHINNIISPPRSGVVGNSKLSSRSSSSSSSFQLNIINSNVLVLLLSSSVLLWMILCLHIHLQLINDNGANKQRPLANNLLRRIVGGDRQAANAAKNINKEEEEAKEEAEEGLSACLLVNDENPRLPEWLAYHYHILPLRSLIVALDPASRSSPHDILGRWKSLMGLDVKIWKEKDLMPYGGQGACPRDDPERDCLKEHRRRQQSFIRKCMRDFQKRNKSWVLLTDVDEYITFNIIHDNDPPPPLDAAPEGIPTIGNWTWKRTAYTDNNGKYHDDTIAMGQIYGLPKEGWHGKHNGDKKNTLPLINTEDEIYYGAYGSIFTDNANNKYYLRDDHAYRDAVDIAPEDVPDSIPTIKDSYIKDGILYGTIYNDNNDDNEKREDGSTVQISTFWKEWPSSSKPLTTVHGGHYITDVHNYKYYVVRDTYLWSPHLSSQQLLDIRQRLPTVDSGKTIMDVLNTEMVKLGQYSFVTIGPCLEIPRVLFGSVENGGDETWLGAGLGVRANYDMAPRELQPELNDTDFITLRYRWHALPDTRVNKYQKTIIDVRRIPKEFLRGEADNIHTPVIHYCREKQPPRYTTSIFRVNHYLDSFEAYSYRNDARDTVKRRKMYNEKSRGAARTYDDDIRPWLKSFVASVGVEKAKILLHGAGNFVRLDDKNVIQERNPLKEMLKEMFRKRNDPNPHHWHLPQKKKQGGK